MDLKDLEQFVKDQKEVEADLQEAKKQYSWAGLKLLCFILAKKENTTTEEVEKRIGYDALMCIKECVGRGVIYFLPSRYEANVISDNSTEKPSRSNFPHLPKAPIEGIDQLYDILALKYPDILPTINHIKP